MNLRQLFEQYIGAYRPQMRRGFVHAVVKDTLSERQLGVYLAQDIHYLEAMARNLKTLAQYFDDSESRLLLKKHSEDALNTSKAMRESLRVTAVLRSMASDPIRPTTYAYLNHQRLSIARGLRIGLWSLLPCYLFYPTFVRELRKSKPKRKFLRVWVESLPEYDDTIEWKDQIEDLFFAVNRADRKSRVEEVFTISAHYELEFLAMAMAEEPWLLGSLPERNL